MAKAFFQQTNQNGVSLHSHLTEVIHNLVSSKDPHALENFENISLDVKAKHFQAAEPGLKNLVPPPNAFPSQDAYKKRCNKLFSVVDTSENDQGVPNVLEESSMFEWAGVGLSKEETYRLFLAMTQLKAEHGLKSVRFFGKILGTQSDYYIIEGTKDVTWPPAQQLMEKNAPVPPEPQGMGLNMCSYFVSGDVSQSFVELPDVTPQQIVAATLIKKYFTGNLDAPVRCYPAFPGPEKAYLRAQISRIAAATVLVPAGKLELEEPEEGPVPPPKPVEEYEPKAPAEMVEGESWCHLYGKILKIGRCTNPPKPEPGEDEEEAEEEEPEEEGPPLGAVSDDPQISEVLPEMPLPAWSFKLHFSEGRDGVVAIAKSNRWPGAYSAAVMKADKYANLYIGYGAESTGTSFTPQPPPQIMMEAPDVEEEEEVTVAKENEILKAIDDAKREAENAEEEEGED